MTKQQLYEEAMDTFRFESSVFRAAQADYRSRKIGDADFLAARKRFNAANEASDLAEAELLGDDAEPLDAEGPDVHFLCR